MASTKEGPLYLPSCLRQHRLSQRRSLALFLFSPPLFSPSLSSPSLSLSAHSLYIPCHFPLIRLPANLPTSASPTALLLALFRLFPIVEHAR